MASTLTTARSAAARPTHLEVPGEADAARRRYRREASMGQRCPQCAGPLVFGEGCSLCPVCGYSGCSV